MGHDLQNWLVTVVHAVNVSTTRRRVELSCVAISGPLEHFVPFCPARLHYCCQLLYHLERIKWWWWWFWACSTTCYLSHLQMKTCVANPWVRKVRTSTYDELWAENFRHRIKNVEEGRFDAGVPSYRYAGYANCFKLLQQLPDGDTGSLRQLVWLIRHFFPDTGQTIRVFTVTLIITRFCKRTPNALRVLIEREEKGLKVAFVASWHEGNSGDCGQLVARLVCLSNCDCYRTYHAHQFIFIFTFYSFCLLRVVD